MAYGKHLRMLWNYHPGRLTGLPNLPANVAHILKSWRGFPSSFFQNSGHCRSQIGQTHRPSGTMAPHITQ